MEFEPDYFYGMLKVLMLTILISIVPVYYTDNSLLTWIISIIGFFAVLLLNNKKWIKKVKLDFDNKVININYPLNFIGIKESQIEFKEIEKVTYFEYEYRTPAHFRIDYNGKKLRFNCSEDQSKKISSILKDLGIETNFYHNKDVGFR